MNLLPMIQSETAERPLPIGFQSRDQRALSDNHYKIYSRDKG